MSWIPRLSSPLAVLHDFLAFVRQREREHVIGASLAVLVTMIIVIVFLVDPKINTAPPPQVTYVELYSSNRTDAEIIADQKKDAAARLAAKKEKQRQFQELENQLGM
ncbi:MAG: hypothetical protein ABI853_08845 [Sphingomicrobium sp.]